MATVLLTERDRAPGQPARTRLWQRLSHKYARPAIYTGFTQSGAARQASVGCNLGRLEKAYKYDAFSGRLPHFLPLTPHPPGASVVADSQSGFFMRQPRLEKQVAATRGPGLAFLLARAREEGRSVAEEFVCDCGGGSCSGSRSTT